MTAAFGSHLSFSVSRAALKNGILIPKYYDPELSEADRIAANAYHLPTLADLLAPEHGSRLGSWIPREHYGSGVIPFVRTSDINDFRLRPDYKKGVSRQIYEQVAARQDVRAGDILMVAHGTYLVGHVAIVTESDLPLVLQDHVFRLRVRPDEGLADPWILLAALSTSFVRRQIRARQFSADIIDKIGNRHLEVHVPLPKDEVIRSTVSREIREIVAKQSTSRSAIANILSSDMRMTRERAGARFGFSLPRSSVFNRILIPKYYDPELRTDLAAAEERTTTSWIPIEALKALGVRIDSGVEVGKMAYGTGNIPFIRTTDIAELEVKSNPRQGISADLYHESSSKAGVVEHDVLLIRDGTYLVGSSAIVTKSDTPALISGGILRIRATDPAIVSPYVVLGSLNLPLVRRQLRAKQFTRDVIDTLGKRYLEVRVPDPRSEFARELGRKLANEMRIKGAIRSQMRATIASIEPAIPAQSSGRPGWSMRG